MSYGLLSALSWGISTLLAAVAARRIGTLRTVVGCHIHPPVKPPQG
jgi:hypothetical protein